MSLTNRKEVVGAGDVLDTIVHKPATGCQDISKSLLPRSIQNDGFLHSDHGCSEPGYEAFMLVDSRERIRFGRHVLQAWVACAEIAPYHNSDYSTTDGWMRARQGLLWLGMCREVCKEIADDFF